MAAPAADRPAMFDLAAKLIEDRLGAFGVGRLRTHQSQQLALARRRGRTADRTFHQRCTFGADLRREINLHLRRHRAHLDEQLALHVARQQPGRPVIDGVDRRAVGEDGDDRVALGGKIGRRGRDLGPGFSQRLGLFRRTIPDGDVVADFHEPRRQVAAHGAETGNSDFHSSSPSAFAGDDRRSRRGRKAARRRAPTRQCSAHRLRNRASAHRNNFIGRNANGRG